MPGTSIEASFRTCSSKAAASPDWNASQNPQAGNVNTRVLPGNCCRNPTHELEISAAKRLMAKATRSVAVMLWRRSCSLAGSAKLVEVLPVLCRRITELSSCRSQENLCIATADRISQHRPTHGSHCLQAKGRLPNCPHDRWDATERKQPVTSLHECHTHTHVRIYIYIYIYTHPFILRPGLEETAFQLLNRNSTCLLSLVLPRLSDSLSSESRRSGAPNRRASRNLCTTGARRPFSLDRNTGTEHLPLGSPPCPFATSLKEDRQVANTFDPNL